MNPMKEKEGDTEEILPAPIPVVQTPGPPIDDPCAGLPTTPGEYVKIGTRNADGTCSIGSWAPK